MDEVSIISLVGMIATILSVAMLYFKSIISIDRRLTRIETKTELFWGMVEKELPRILKAPTHVEMDGLLDKMTDKKLSMDEAMRLRTILRRKIKNTDGEKITACALVLVRLEQILIDGGRV